MIKDIYDNPIQVGDFLLYVTRTEAPSIQFGWVEEIKDMPHQGEVRVKIAHADKAGNRLMKTVFEDRGNGYQYFDTDSPSVAWLKSYVNHTNGIDKRFLIHQPI